MITINLRELIFICYTLKKAPKSLISYYLALSKATQKKKLNTAQISQEKAEQARPFIELYIETLKKIDKNNKFVKANTDHIKNGVLLAEGILKKIAKE